MGCAIRRKTQAILHALCYLAILDVIGCTTQSSQSSSFPFEPFRVDLSRYESVQKRGKPQNPELALAVAISGGGHRAGQYGIAVLTALELVRLGESNVLQEVDYLSTASGGGFAAAIYISELYAHTQQGKLAATFDFAQTLAEDCTLNPPDPQAGRYEGDRCLRAQIEYNYRLPLWKRITPKIIFTALTSGDALETEFDDRLLGRIRHDGKYTMTLSKMFVSRECVPVLPYWVANATVYENGAILPLTPDVLERYNVTGWNHRMKNEEKPPGDLPLSVALKASASFPVLIPSTILRTSRTTEDRYMRLTDGGQADNLGILTALDLLLTDPAKPPRRVLLVVDAYPGTGSPYTTSTRSALPFPVFYRAADISLDSWRGRYREIVASLGQQHNVRVVALPFELAAQPADQHVPPQCQRLAEEVQRRKWDVTTEEDRRTLMDRARGVGTDLKISPAEREDLQRAGHVVVLRACKQIVDVITSSESQK